MSVFGSMGHFYPLGWYQFRRARAFCVEESLRPTFLQLQSTDASVILRPEMFDAAGEPTRADDSALGWELREAGFGRLRGARVRRYVPCNGCLPTGC